MHTTLHLPANALPLLQEPGEEIPAKAKDRAWSVQGLVGYVCTHFRPDATFAYVAVSQQVATNLTPFVYRCIIQTAKYLVATRDLPLTFRRKGRDTGKIPISFWADSSAMNANPGSWGGFCANAAAPPTLDPNQPYKNMTTEKSTSAPVLWKQLSPRKFADSSAGAECVLASHAIKPLIAMRMVLTELNLLWDSPTPLCMDAMAAMQSSRMERITFPSKYMSTRIAMLRQTIRGGLADPFKVSTHDNCADIFTKPLVGEKFVEMRAKVLGLNYVKSTNATPPPSPTPTPKDTSQSHQRNPKKVSFSVPARGAAQLSHEHQHGNEYSSDVTGDGARTMSDSDDDGNGTISGTDGHGVHHHYYPWTNPWPYLAAAPPAPGPMPAPAPSTVAPAEPDPVAPNEPP